MEKFKAAKLEEKFETSEDFINFVKNEFAENLKVNIQREDGDGVILEQYEANTYDTWSFFVYNKALKTAWRVYASDGPVHSNDIFKHEGLATYANGQFGWAKRKAIELK